MLENGFICLHRSILTWEWYGDINVRSVFLHLLLIANYEDKQWRGQLIKRGQTVISTESLASETRLTRQEVRTALLKLISTNEITCMSTNKYTVVTIVNYGIYQDKECVSNQQNNQPGNQQITNNQPTNNHNETNKQKRLKDSSSSALGGAEGKGPKRFYAHSEKYFKAALWLSERVIENSPRKMKAPTEMNLQSWADIFRLMEERDKLPWTDIRAVLNWAVNDDWWRAQILSAGNFRKHYNYLAAKMGRTQTQSEESINPLDTGYVNAADFVNL